MDEKQWVNCEACPRNKGRNSCFEMGEMMKGIELAIRRLEAMVELEPDVLGAFNAMNEFALLLGTSIRYTCPLHARYKPFETLVSACMRGAEDSEIVEVSRDIDPHLHNSVAGPWLPDLHSLENVLMIGDALIETYPYMQLSGASIQRHMSLVPPSILLGMITMGLMFIEAMVRKDNEETDLDGRTKACLVADYSSTVAILNCYYATREYMSQMNVRSMREIREGLNNMM